MPPKFASTRRLGKFKYTQANLQKGKKFVQFGLIPKNYTAQDKRKRFITKWKGLNQRNNIWFIGKRMIIFDDDQAEKERLIKEYYEDPKTGFLGAVAILDKINEKYIGIGKKQVEDVLARIPTVQKQRRTRSETQAKPMIISKPGRYWQIDVKVLPNSVRGKGFLLNAIDVHSKYAMSKAITRETMTKVIEALDGFLVELNALNVQPSIIQGDGAFHNAELRAWAVQNQIKLLKSLSHKPTSNGAIERFNGTISSMLFRYMENNNTKDWLTGLDDIVKNYNNTVHSATKHKPIDAIVGDAVMSAKVKENIIKAVRPDKNKFMKIVAGDMVRVSVVREFASERRKLKSGFRKGHNPDGNYTDTVFTVQRARRKHALAKYPTYNLVGRDIIYKRSDLLLIPADTFARPAQARIEPADNDDVDGGGNQPRRGARVRRRVDPGVFVGNVPPAQVVPVAQVVRRGGRNRAQVDHGAVVRH